MGLPRCAVSRITMLNSPICRRAFTLVELLVVLAIIAVLMGLLLPSLAGTRQEARAVPCASNLRAVGQGMAIYAKDARYYPPSYVYGDSVEGPTWKIADQGDANSTSLHGYIHWSFGLLGDGQKVPEGAFTCPAAPKGGAPATNPGLDPDAWDHELQQRNDAGSTSPSEPPKDRQARRMAFVANAAIVPRNKFAGSTLRKSQLVREGAVTFTSKTILATELVHLGDWRTVFSENQSRSHRPITPFVGVTTGEDVHLQPDATVGGSFRYPPTDQIKSREQLGPGMIVDGSTVLNAVGRSHASGDSWIGGSANFVFIDGHVERMTVMNSLTKKLWGDKFYSMTGRNTRVGQ